MAKITLNVCDYAYFVETCTDRFMLTEVSCDHGWIGSDVTIEGRREVIEEYLHQEYMVGMDSEMKAEILESIED